MSYEGVMAGRTYPAMEDPDRRPLPWSATMPNLEYGVSGYSGHHTDITQESHHALTAAYDDLKKRYNDLQGKLTQTAKQLRDVQRRGSNPDLPSTTGSPRHSGGSYRGRAQPPLEEQPHNGDLGDIELLGRERDLLERQVVELEQRLSEAADQLADKEHEARQLREHVSRQEDDLRQNQRILEHTEGENEKLNKRLSVLKRQLRAADADKLRAGDSDKPPYAGGGGAGSGAAGSQNNSLNSSLDPTPFPGPGGRAAAGSGVDSALNGELQMVLMNAVAAREEVKELRSILQKQREVILMLVNRQTTEQRESLKRRAEITKQAELATCGIGARPKVRNNGAAGIPSAAAPSSRTHIVHPVACTEDILQHDRTISNSSSRLAQSQLMRSPDRVAQRALARQRGTLERLSAPAVLGSSSSSSVKSGLLNPENMHDPPENELESHYDDLQFGGGVSVPWERGTEGETNTEDMEPLLPSPPGRLGKRNESMEHLHDDSDPYDLVEELESTTSGSTLCGTDEPEPEYAGGYEQITEPGSHPNLEDSFQNTGSPRHQRSLNMDRNEYRAPGSLTRSIYDNTAANVNMNTPNRENKFTTGGTTTTESKPEQSFPNNTSAGGSHKVINTRNLYPGTAPARRISPEPTPPPRRVGRTPVEQASGEEFATPEPRNCPVCNEDFPSHLAMEEFQQHVLECSGRTERICPMCDATFPDEVLQVEFERHVNEHFEDDTTLQFEVMTSSTS